MNIDEYEKIIEILLGSIVTIYFKAGINHQYKSIIINIFCIFDK